MKIKLQIKNRFTSSILFEYEKEGNTLKETVLEAVKSRADLSGAYLSGANLSRADFSRSDLSGANLSRADFSRADFSRADFSGADLSGANLSRSDLSRADFSGANLSRSDLSGAYLSGAKNAEYAIAMTRICAEGNIIGYKKAQTLEGKTVIVELLIPAEAKRNNAFGRKCRAEFATVMEIKDLEGKDHPKAKSSHDSNFIYEIGDTIRPKEPYDENFQNECSSGIHFFITKLEAENY